ncbi:hypothetical protein [Nonomuraea sp. NPDC050643]|uniref:hypothetical protein n=1 Tax=Nonomuraea sp. NPDC050643 TaxID=3155660 RepID=UPI0033E98A8E
MTILITGATGTVSSAVLSSLAGQADVRVLVRDAAKAPSGVRVAVGDLDDVAAEVLRDPARHKGATYTLTGPAAISLREAAGELEQVYGRPIAYRPVSPDDAYRSMREAGMSEWLASVNREYLTAYAAGWGDYTTTAVEDVLGRPARSFATFAHDHATALRP